MVKLLQFPKFKGFAGETKLHGIPRTVEGSWAAIGFWAILAIVCTGMAINDLIDMVGHYRSDDTVIQVSLKDNTNYTWPTPTLCMEVVQQYLDLGRLGRLFQIFDSTSIERYIDSFIPFYENLDRAVNYSVISDVEPRADPNLIYYPYMMLGYLQQLEHNLLGTTQQYLTDYQLSQATNDPQLSGHIERIYNYYRSKNVTMEKLTKWIGMLVCLNALTNQLDVRKFNVEAHFENYRYFGDPQYILLPFCRADLITQLGFGMVCTKLFKEPTVPIRPGYNYFTIYEGLMIDPKGDPNNFAAAMETKVVPNLQWHLDLQGRDMVPADRSGIFSWNPYEFVVLDISVSSERQFLNLQSRPCSDAVETQYQCQWRKRLELFQAQCGCSPTLVDLFKSNESEADSCNKLVLGGLTTLIPSQFCPSVDLTQLDTSACLWDCHKTNLKFTRQKPTRMLDVNFATSTALRGQFEFRFINEQSQLIEEQPQYDWDNFMGQWGGSIGTWLGASVLSFVHIPVYLLRQYCSRKKLDSSEG